MQKTIPFLSDRDWQKSLAAIMTALTCALLLLCGALTARLDGADARLSAVAQKAFYETCELTEAMSVSLRKLLVAGDAGQLQLLLNDVARQAQGASGNLALLPMGEETVADTLKFINQAGDFASALSVRIADGGAVSETDYQTLSALSKSAAEFSVGMSQLLARIENGEATLSGDAASGGESLYPLSNPASSYPTLLYDGPFSDGARGGELRALEGLPTVSEAEARRNLQAYFDQAQDIRMVGESSIPAECYEFAFTSGGYSLSAGVTRQGGQVLYALCADDVTEVNFTAEQLLDTARAFLISRGYGPMEMSYYSRYDGILTVNYAAVQDGVTLYPDLVKVQLSMRDGAVIGVEAGNYLTNHRVRALKKPALSEEDAFSRLAPNLTALAVRLCVIPDGASEALCYEVRATDGADTFLVYIDAQTGLERELLEVVRDDRGSLVQ